MVTKSKSGRFAASPARKRKKTAGTTKKTAAKAKTSIVAAQKSAERTPAVRKATVKRAASKKSVKIDPWSPKGRFLRPGFYATGPFLARMPQGPPRAGTSKPKNDRGAVGAGSDTPWAVGPANLPPGG